MKHYYRPILTSRTSLTSSALQFAGTRLWFDRAQLLARDHSSSVVAVSDVPDNVLERWTQPRAAIAGMDFVTPKIMGILNVTPDSFSDGGDFETVDAAVARAASLCDAGADIIDIGGESTRPGAVYVPVNDEIARIEPVIEKISKSMTVPISLDTRKAPVAERGLAVGASIINDVSGFTFDTDLIRVCVDHQVPVCVMHAQGDPKTMQDSPQYDHVVADVYDFLETQIDQLVGAGLARSQIIADPGVGFGKTLDHNLELLNHIGVFHGLGVPILLGVSRKGMIKTIGHADRAKDRMPGSVAVALAAMEHGVQIFRVHDVAETKQAFALWHAVQTGERHGA
jgi:dihydropteroate synthase